MADKNYEVVLNELSKDLDDLRSGEITLPEAAGRANTAGKMIGLIKCKLTYSALREEQPDVPFMVDGREKKKSKKVKSAKSA